MSCTVIGTINWDITLFIERFPIVDEEILVDRVMEFPGGKGSNVSVAITKLIGPNSTTLIGSLGDDEKGRIHQNLLKENGIDTSCIKSLKGEKSGQAFILVDNKGKKIICTFLGANCNVFINDLTDRIFQKINQTKLIIILDSPLEVSYKIAKTFSEKGKMVIFSPGPRCKMGIKSMENIIRNCDYIIANRIEFNTLAGNADLDKAKEIVSRFNKDLRMIVTLGEKGSVLASSKDLRIQKAIQLKEKGYKVINTVGCGDVFTGAFASFKVEGLSDIDAIKNANIASAFKATKAETQGSPFRSELEDFMKNIKIF
jgi:ribokinase